MVLYRHMKKLLLLLPSVVLLAGCTAQQVVTEPVQRMVNEVKEITQSAPAEPETIMVDFAQYNPVFRFTAALPAKWQVEYVPGIESINIYDPAAAGDSVRQQSQIFIRHFTANRFLTLSTVDILQRQETTVRGHDAVRYEIVKQPGVADFPQQPSWRNQQHDLIDIRLTDNAPSPFYVLARNPQLPADDFAQFIDSLVFHNDQESLVSPMDQIDERVTKKPFGIFITPENSPVSPERFSGHHTGIDFEILPGEENSDVPVYAFCGGPLRLKRTASGYGGVAVQECLIDDQVVTVVYGHIDLSSVEQSVGQYVAPGQQLAVLGAGGSADTDGERKHLHFAIHTGSAIELAGYVSRESQLSNWLDPLEIIVQ